MKYTVGDNEWLTQKNDVLPCERVTVKMIRCSTATYEQYWRIINDDQKAVYDEIKIQYYVDHFGMTEEEARALVVGG